MNKFILLSMLSITHCFSATPQIWPNLEKAWQVQSPEKIENGVTFLTDLINDPLVSDVDKVHYLCSRMQLHSLMHREDLQSMDMNTLQEMCTQIPECASELWLFYEHSFNPKLGVID